MPKGLEEFICISKIIFAINVKFRHPNFDIKGGIIHLVIPFFFKYCYATEICIDFLLVKMKGSINKEMVKKMKRMESLESELSAN